MSSPANTNATDYEGKTAFLGEWGRFQILVMFLLCLTIIPNGFTALAIVFLADTPAHSCLVPAKVNLTSAWRNSSIPLDENEKGEVIPSKCYRYKLDDLVNFSERGLLPGIDVNLSNVPKENCLDGWDFDHSVYISTIVTEWDLVCDRSWRNPLTSSLFFCGVFSGSFISGQLSDRYGRKKVLFASLALQMFAAFVESFSQNWITFAALYFLIGLAQSSNYLAAFVLGTEILGPRARTVYSTVGVCGFFAIGYMLLPVLAFFIRDWRMLLLWLSLPNALCLPFWWFIPESPRWLLSQDRLEEAEAIIRKAAKTNNKEPPADIFRNVEKKVNSKKKGTHNICDLLRTGNIRWISISLWLVWNTLTIAYYGLSLNTSNLHGNSYFNCFLSALVEVPAYALSWVLFRWCSRRVSLSSTLLMGGLFLLIIQLIPTNMVYFAITLEMIGKFAVTTAFAIVYAYTAELYPTVLRNTAVGTCSMASRIGSIIAPFFVFLRSYSVSLPYILMGTLTTLAGLLSLLLPESFGMPLPETITHMQQFPGCCRKTLMPYTITPTDEEENTGGENTAHKMQSTNHTQ